MGSATGGILSRLIVLQADTQAGTSRPGQPSQRLRSMSVASLPALRACAFFGHAIPEVATAPAETFRNALRLSRGLLSEFLMLFPHERSIYR